LHEGVIRMEDRKKEFESEIAGYRQPMVTSVGIVLGFLLAFLANWASQADASSPALYSASDFIIALALFGSAVLFTIVLFRMLNNRIHDNAAARYQTTFRIYICGFLLAFSGLAVALVV
jgi:hypothetical protein